MERYRFSEQEQTIFEGLQQPFAVYQFVNKQVVTLALSDGFCEMFGYEDKQEAYYDMDHDMYKNTHPDDSARIADAAFRFATEEIPYDVIYRTKKKNTSDYFIIHSIGKHVYTKDGVRLAHVWYTNEGKYCVECSENKSGLNGLLNKALHEESLVKASNFNFLTGLPSMTYFFELAEMGKKTILENGGKPALLFMDLNGMKYYNAKNGFSEGDKLLQEFAHIIADIFHSENCCHISGDHFTVYTNEDGLEDTLHKLFKRCSKLNGENSLPVRVGIYRTSLEDVPVSVACDRAKLACDSIRNTFESSFNYYNAELSDDAERRQYVLSNVDRAISEGWIKVYYQPIVRAVNGHVCDEEALARWIDPVRGFMSPAHFIPYLEDAKLLYKLDINMLEQVLVKMKYQKEHGFNIVPHSVNLSRSDFEACDIVEEVRKRVDASGIGRDMITIEITESIIGNNFDFMKKQIERFRELGFPVWMDDFGSGYSSLDVLSSIEFDLIKFDMIFMRKFEADPKRKIILTELMRMANSLGLDTICEGVETEEQVHFLQEIGCSKLQGFYFDKPIPLEQILEKYKNGTQIGYEDPKSSNYYEVMGRVNLYDLAAVANGDENDLHNFFNTLPMGIMEMQNGHVRFVRSNPSYRDFIKRFFDLQFRELGVEYKNVPPGSGEAFLTFMKQCCSSGKIMFYDENMPDGSVVHSMARRIAHDPVTDKTAIAVAVLSVTESNEGTTYATIARALAADYYNIYYVDLETEKFIEYSSPVGQEELAIERHGDDFFEVSRRDTMVRIYEEDRAPFLIGFTKENVIHQLDEHGSFTITYRLIDTGEPMYVNMKVMRMNNDTRHIIIGISVVDSQMKELEFNDALQREETAYARIMALSGGYLSLYTVDPETNGYFEYSASNEYSNFGFAKTGEDFFRDGIINGRGIVYSEDLPLYLSRFTKDTVLNEIKENGMFQLHYRIVINGIPRHVVLKIVPVKENSGNKLIAGLRLWKDRK